MAAPQKLQMAKRALDKLKSDFARGNFAACENTLTDLKLHLVHFPAVPPRFEASSTAEEELLIGRDCLEHAVFLSVKQQDEDSFERNFMQLNSYYTDTKGLMPPSDNELLVRGLNLLRLLVQSRIAEFHVELETLTPEVQKSPYIKYAISLEQSHMEGAYNKILNSSKECPHESCVPFCEKLIESVRDEIGACSEQAYESLSVQEAQKMLGFTRKADMLAYAEKNDWVIEDGRIIFQGQAQEMSELSELNSMDLIRNTLHYAKEIERIV